MLHVLRVVGTITDPWTPTNYWPPLTWVVNSPPRSTRVISFKHGGTPAWHSRLSCAESLLMSSMILAFGMPEHEVISDTRSVDSPKPLQEYIGGFSQSVSYCKLGGAVEMWWSQLLDVLVARCDHLLLKEVHVPFLCWWHCGFEIWRRTFFCPTPHTPLTEHLMQQSHPRHLSHHVVVNVATHFSNRHMCLRW